MTREELQKSITAFFTENPLANQQDIQADVAEAYNKVMALQIPEYKPTEIESHVGIDTTFKEKRDGVSYNQAKDESTWGDIEGL